MFAVASLLVHLHQCLKRQGQQKAHDDDMYNALIHSVRSALVQKRSVILRKTGCVLLDGSSCSNYWRDGPAAAFMEKTVVEGNSLQVLLADPQIVVQLNQWTSYISTQNAATIDPSQHLLLVTALIDGGHSEPAAHDALKVTDVLCPLAWRSGRVFGIVGQCSSEGVERLTSAFFHGRLVLGEQPLDLIELCSVSVEGHTSNPLHTHSTPFPVYSHQSPSEASPVVNEEEESREDSNCPTKTVVSGAGEALSEEIRDLSSSASLCKTVESGAGESLSEEIRCLSDSGLPGKSVENGGGETLSGSVDEWSSLSDLGSPSKCGGAGEALSPTVEDSTLLAPFRLAHRQAPKPPNVLIYCGKKDSTRTFEAFKGVFSLCLNSEKYVLYQLRHSDVLTAPWQQNTAALLICCDRLYDDIHNAFLQYFQQGGVVCSFSSSFDELFTDRDKRENPSRVLNLVYGSQKEPVLTICGNFNYSRELRSRLSGVELRSVGVDTEGRHVIVEAAQESTGGGAILSQCNLDKDPSEIAITSDIYSLLKQANPGRFSVLTHMLGSLGLDTTPGPPPVLTPCVLVCTSQTSQDLLYQSILRRSHDGVLTSGQLKLQFLESFPLPSQDVATEKKPDTVPVIVKPPDEYLRSKFNTEEYSANLQTRLLGNTVIYSDVVTSTMPIVDALTYSLPEGVGLVAIARSQTVGRGRGGNAWISPDGCAMFSLHLKVLLSSPLGQRVSFIQHIASLATVQAVTQLPGYQDLPLRLKWPNDIYYENKVKVGGVIVNSSVIGNIININIGCGVNLSNQNPTSCVNELIEVYNKSHNERLSPLSREQFIARTVTQIEQMVDAVQSQGIHTLLAPYYSKWLHSGQTVEISGEEDKATVLGLDDYGYLEVALQDGRRTSLHPDGNSFDLLRNLIIPKY